MCSSLSTTTTRKESSSPMICASLSTICSAMPTNCDWRRSSRKFVSTMASSWWRCQPMEDFNESYRRKCWTICQLKLTNHHKRLHDQIKTFLISSTKDKELKMASRILLIETKYRVSCEMILIFLFLSGSIISFGSYCLLMSLDKLRLINLRIIIYNIQQ